MGNILWNDTQRKAVSASTRTPVKRNLLSDTPQGHRRASMSINNIQPRVIPKTAKTYKLKFKKKYGSVGLSSDGKLKRREINQLQNPNAVLIAGNVVKIFFPKFDTFFVREYQKSGGKGFTVEDVLKLINITGYEAMEIEFQLHPENFNTVSKKVAARSVGEYAITEFYIRGKNVYVDVEH